MNTLTPAQLHALAVVAKGASKVRKDLVVDQHEVDFTVHVAGTLSVSGDQTVSVARKPTATDIGALLLGQFGPRKRKSIVAALADGNLADAIDDDLRELATELVDRLASSTEQVRRGSVSGKITAHVE